MIKDIFFRFFKKVSKMISYLFLICIALNLIINVAEIAKNRDYVAPADGFKISYYNVTLDVQENNIVDVTENIIVDFTSNYKHGIIKFTPEWLEYTGKNGKTIKRKSQISSLRAIEEKYSVDTIKKKKRIKIGSANEYVGKGEKNYIINYKYDMGKDPYKGFDEFIFHAFGDYWGTEIKNASIKVIMPKNIEGNSINFYMDKYRQENANSYIDYTVSNNILTAVFNQKKYEEVTKKIYCQEKYHQNDDGTCNLKYYHPKNLEKSLTVDIELPNNYFVGGSWNYGLISAILCFIVLGLTIWNFYRWKKYGKDFPKKSITVEFYPPEKFSAAEIGYIYGNKDNKKLTISLIVGLASKGYIKIDELKRNKIQITNLIIRPKAQYLTDSSVPKRKIKIKKLKPIDTNLLNHEELTMMKYLFSKSDEKELTSKVMILKFVTVKDSLIEKGFIEITSDTEMQKELEQTKLKLETEKKEYQLERERYEEELRKHLPLTDLEEMVYDKLFTSDNVIILSEHKTFYKVFKEIEYELKNKFDDVLNDSIATKKCFSSLFISIVVLILSFISYFVIEDMDPKWSFLYTLSFACIFLNLFFTFIMKRKTQRGVELISKIKGFRKFLITAEKPKLEALVLENPQYFYQILPYTYVLNISKKWIKKFEDIPIPEMDMGSFSYDSDFAYYNLYDNVYYPKTTYSSSSSSSGCSSCGGGCSSCGGGCSSCGGGSSW